ncbi:helix-turn-helix domain-containing protein [Candidatus Enterococcus ferrettii]|uniref:Mga helix-turn-helix domain-containing protein n=1 Tax=Candidatus Enterococcus ferrettii TaxID=2815324 RepID=A0ABV0ETH9_9ENTE|nr:helix-turn-helix domain-containing protein [Enterococcus sp. 665A]MBO1342189.1 helix-turn-helix domain-containing protein [Enterococcus sp. 665A]
MNLRCLLKRESQRKLLLIETLYYSKHPKTSDQLIQLLDCTPPALSRYIRSINQNEDPYYIHRENGLYSLMVAENATIDALISSLIRQSLSFKILEITLFEEFFTLQKLAKALHCSVATLQAHLTELENVIACWNLTIERKPYRLVGNEKAIRHLFYLLFFEKKTQKSELCYSNELFEKGDAVLRSLIENNQLNCSYAQYRRLRMMFFISLERIRHHHFFPQYFLSSLHVTPPDQKICREFDKELVKEFGISYTHEVMKESFWLLYCDLVLLGEQQKRHALFTNYFLSQQYANHYQLVEEFDDLLLEPLTSEKKSQLTDLLINQNLYHIDTKEYISLLRDGKQDYINLLENFHAHCVHKIRQLVMRFTTKYHCFQSEEFINSYVYQLIAAVPECLTGMKQYDEPVRLLIVASDPTTREGLLAQLIQSSVRGNYTISHSTFNYLDQTNYLEELNNHDLILRTSEIDLPPCSTPILAIESCPSIFKLHKLQHMVEKIYQKKNIRTNKSSGVL